mmetsp:Transcript_8199/g.16221  ORF Transcript_8199/g.16221 Transcript_8199/m.16221 type:complete len:362 (-) Transcript_8199:422-1507(-)
MPITYMPLTSSAVRWGMQSFPAPSPESLRRAKIKSTIERATDIASERKQRVARALAEAEHCEAEHREAEQRAAEEHEAEQQMQQQQQTSNKALCTTSTILPASAVFSHDCDESSDIDADSPISLIKPFVLISMAKALDALLTHATKRRITMPCVPLLAASVDCAGPSLVSIFELVGADAGPSAPESNVLEIFAILSLAAKRAEMHPSSLLDAFIFLDRAISAGLAFTPTLMRRQLVAALALAHKRERAIVWDCAVHSQDFAAECFPELQLERIEVAELRLSQALGHNLDFVDEPRRRHRCMLGLSIFGDPHAKVQILPHCLRSSSRGLSARARRPKCPTRSPLGRYATCEPHARTQLPCAD